MIFFASILVAGLASTSWARPAAQTANNGASSSAPATPTTEAIPADCSILSIAFPSVYNSSVNCCTVGNNVCHNQTLTNITLPNNGLQGPIPDLSELTNLMYINLSFNALTGSIHDMFGNMTQLTQVDLSSNYLTGSLPPSLLNSPSLTTLNVGDNWGLTGQFGDKQSTNLPAITKVDIDGTGLTVVDPLKTKLGLSAFGQGMANSNRPPPNVPVGSGDDPWVTWLDPGGNWHTQQVNDPSALLNGNYVVSAIGGVNICSGNWAFLYQVPTPAEYPSCQGNFGAYNTGANNQYGTVNYSNLKYGTCPQSVYHWGVGGSQWGTETYSHCWTGYYNWGTSNSGTGGISIFPNGMRVGYCCFN